MRARLLYCKNPSFTEDANQERVCVAEIEVSGGGRAAGDVAFHTTNAPAEFLDATGRKLQADIFRQQNAYRAKHGFIHTSMSVGDAVEVDGELWMCANSGWIHITPSDILDK